MSLVGTPAFKISADQLIRDESFVDEFVCKICQVHVVGCGPQLTKCSHLFCGDCLQQWFSAHPDNQTWAQRAKTGGAVPCPVCKTMLRKENDLYPVTEHGNANSQRLWGMIQGLHIKCDATHSGCVHGCCTWKGTIGSYLRHLQSGTCGTLEPEVPDTNQEIISLNEFAKECSPSPSTYSEVGSVTSLEELGTDDFSSEECSVEEETEGDKLPLSDAVCGCASLGLKTEECSTTSAEDSAMPSQFDYSVLPATAPKPSSPKPAKSNKNKKQKQNAHDSVVRHASKTCSQPTLEQWQQACQWQYQMACAQRYQMVIQAARMQQYYQQLHMCAVRQ